MKTLMYPSILTLSVFLTACGGDTEAKTNNGQSTQKNNTSTSVGELKQASNNNAYISPLPADAPSYEVVTFEFIPYASKDEYGNPIGYDVDILHAISEEQGVKFNFTEVKYSQVFSSLQAGKYDLAMSGLFLLPERQKMMEVGNVYTQTRIGHIVKADSPYEKVEQLQTKKIALLENSPTHRMVLKMGVDKTNISFVKSEFLLFQHVLSGKEDAGSGVEANIIFYAEEYPEHPVRFLPYTKPNPATVYAPKGKTELINIFNEGLGKIKASGKYQQINKKWFGEYADSFMIK